MPMQPRPMTPTSGPALPRVVVLMPTSSSARPSPASAEGEHLVPGASSRGDRDRDRRTLDLRRPSRAVRPWIEGAPPGRRASGQVACGDLGEVAGLPRVPVELQLGRRVRGHVVAQRGQVLVPILEQGGGGLLPRRRPAGRGALGPRRVPDGGEVQISGGVRPRRRPGLVSRARQGSQRDDGGDLTTDEEGVEPPVPVGRDRGVVGVPLAAALPVNAVEEGIDHDISARDTDLREQTLYALAGLADQDAPGDRLVCRGVLPQHEDAGRAVEPATMEDRTPLDAEILDRVGVGAGVGGGELVEGRPVVARAERSSGTDRIGHGLIPLTPATVVILLPPCTGDQGSAAATWGWPWTNGTTRSSGRTGAASTPSSRRRPRVPRRRAD